MQDNFRLPNSPKRTTCLLALEELQRREELESLRQFLIIEQCFPTLKDPLTAPVTMEELKKLARAWKLNERRNFWKNHSERNEMVAALLQHVNDNPNLSTKASGKSNLLTPGSPKSDSKPATNHSKKATPPTHIRSSSSRNGDSPNLKNVFGLKYFNREKSSTELLINSRFSKFPNTDSNIDNQIVKWRSEDFNMKDTAAVEISNASKRQTVSGGNVQSRLLIASNGINAKKLKEKKHQSLSKHLVNYSANPELNKSTISVKSVQTFINVAETENHMIVSNCIVALSNISSHPHVRAMLFEINAVHKFTNMIQHVRGAQAMWAATLLFYYFSCDKETEDRVYSTCSSFLQSNGTSKDPEVRLVTLYTLNNLMPCIDRQRVAETTMRIINAQFDVNAVQYDKTLSSTYLLILQNMSAFSNAHATLLSLDIILLLRQIASLAAKDQNAELGLSVVKMLHSFLQIPEQIVNIVTKEFIDVLILLLTIEEDEIRLQCLKVASILSCQTSPTLANLLLVDSKLIPSVSSLFINKNNSNIALVVCRDVAKFFLNVTMQQHSVANTLLIYESKVPEAMIQILRIVDRPKSAGRSLFTTTMNPNMAIAMAIKRLVMKALLNILSVKPMCVKLVELVAAPILKVLSEHHDIGAAQALFNITCVQECREQLVDQGVHLQMMDFLTGNTVAAVLKADTAAINAVKAVYLQILVQVASLKKCVLGLLEIDVIDKLRALIEVPAPVVPTHSSQKGYAAAMYNSNNNHPAVSLLAVDVTLMLLAIVAYASEELSQKDRSTIVTILKMACVKGSSTAVIENCSSVLKCISCKFCEYDYLHPVVKGILELSTSTISESDEVMDSLSTVLYNMTCRAENLPQMLQDAQYVNIMIRIMRKGKLEVQENIAHAMRTLCCEYRCTDILIKTDILSDLIVIALLRTSSEEIKKVCSEAFYNMFCHDKTRLQLLKGDLWWAVMRLCRQDSNEVRTISARALYNFSCDATTVEPLRKHHILSFIKDICTSGGEDFLSKCLSAAHNIIRQFGPDSSDTTVNSVAFEAHEVIASIHIGQEGLSRCTNLVSLRNAIVLLLKCSQNKVDGMVHEFINVEIVDVLNHSKSKWCGDKTCCLYVSRILFELSKSSIFTKANTLSDLDPVCYLLLKEFSSEVYENIAAAFLQFVVAENIVHSQILGTETWSKMLFDVLSNEPKAIAIRAAVNGDTSKLAHRGGGTIKTATYSSTAADISNSESSGNSNSSFVEKRRVANAENTSSTAYSNLHNCKVILLTLFARFVENITSTNPESVTHSLVAGFFTSDMCNDPLTMNHLLIIIHFFSEVPQLCSHLIDAGVYRILDTHLQISVATNGFKAAQEFCATFLRNISLHSQNISKYVGEKGKYLDALLNNTIDDASNTTVNMDVSLFLCNTSDSLVDIDDTIKSNSGSSKNNNNNLNSNNQAVLTPKNALKLIQKISPQIENDKELSAIASINKYTVSNILSNYSFTSGVEPTFVQSMFTYMKKNDVTVPQFAVNLPFKQLTDLIAMRPVHLQSVMTELLSTKFSFVVPLQSFAADDTYWQVR